MIPVTATREQMIRRAVAAYVHGDIDALILAESAELSSTIDKAIEDADDNYAHLMMERISQSARFVRIALEVKEHLAESLDNGCEGYSEDECDVCGVHNRKLQRVSRWVPSVA